MNKKSLKLHLIIGWAIIVALGIVLFPDKDLAQKSEVPHLGQISARTIVAPISFEVPKSAQEIANEKARAADKVYAVFEFNHDETVRIANDLKSYLTKVARYGALQAEISEGSADAADSSLQLKVQQASQAFHVLTKRLSNTAVQQLSSSKRARDSLESVFNRMLDNGVSNTLLATNNTSVQLFRDTYNVQDVNFIPKRKFLLCATTKNASSTRAASSLANALSTKPLPTCSSTSKTKVCRARSMKPYTCSPCRTSFT